METISKLKRLLGPAIIALAGLVLVGCSSATPSLTEPARVSAKPGPGDLVPVTAAAQRSPYLDRALLVLPEAAAPIKTIRERHYANGTRQEIVLDTAKQGAGEGVVDISMLIAPARDGRANDLQLHKPSEDGVRNEIIGRFPDVKMSIVTRTYANSYGPVGVAIGRHASGAVCVFAWQWIENMRSANAGSSGFDKFGAAMTGSGNPASVRIRLCRKDQTADQIVSQIEQLRSGSPDALRRIAQLDRSGADGSLQDADGKGQSASGGALRPVDGSLESMLPKPARGAPQPAAAQPAVNRAAVREARPTPAPRAAARAESQRRVVRVREQEWRNQPTSDRSQPLSDGKGTRRFLAPVQGAQVQGLQAQGVQAVPAQAQTLPSPAPAAARAAPPQTTLPANGQDLPPEAFRGPASPQQPRTLPR